MPCWEVRTMSVEFKAKHLALLWKAVKALGWIYEGTVGGLRVRTSARDSFEIDLAAGKAEIRAEQQRSLNLLKQQYSKEALKRAARLRGWQFKQQQPGQQQMRGVLRK